MRRSEAGNATRLLERLKTLEKIFGNRLYVELQRHGLAEEADVEPELLEFAYSRHLADRRDERVLFRDAG